MDMRRSIGASLLVSLLALMGACGGGKPADSAADADPKAAETKSAEPSGDESKSEAKSDEKADEKKADEKKADGPTASRTPEDILKAPDTVFLFSFNDSEPKQVAEEKCTKKAGDDPKKMNQCMSGERKKFEAKGHRFKQENEQWWWITVRQVGNRLVTVNKTAVEFAEQSDSSVTLKPKDKGNAVVFEVPNDYQIAVKDPKHGRLVFQAKVGSLQE
ncbi:MAG TPA: hypothetical protein VEX18_06900 [Polyangiaceae bacterium]|nr:hypothetical protein [Polyangiaceae bacterium]